ncbi:tryptophan transporter [Anoxybacteroides tepidamans]|uniref:tryptophan transporter n=1 Tax=Anoxybacteroides tepidamans TaxID=265948 RepID=UPI00048628B4|nr:tryptophan transporter [Anoxybacillus tepidamans]
MNAKTLVFVALFIGIGAALHAAVPGFFFGMKPDMMLTMMFLAIILFPNKKVVGLTGIATGIISGITTNFPGGLLPNLIEKPMTAFIFFLLMLLSKKQTSKIAALLTAIGTVASGTVFLLAALFVVGLPGGAAFSSLLVAVVLPTAVVNAIVMLVLHPIVLSFFRRTNIATEV